MKTRLEIINEVRRIRAECLDIINTAEYWNANVRKANEKPIDPDLDGQLKRTIAAMDRTLANEIRISEPQ